MEKTKTPTHAMTNSKAASFAALSAANANRKQAFLITKKENGAVAY